MPCLAMSQIQVTMTETEWKEINNRVDSLKEITENLLQKNQVLSKSNSEKDGVISRQEKTIEDYKAQLSESDKKLNELRSQVEKGKASEDFTKNHLLFADSCILKYANAQLYFKYDPKRVSRALNAMNRIVNKDMKDKVIFENLLKEYKNYYNELKTIVNSAQNNPDRTNPFNGQKFLASFKNQVENTAYCRSCYKKGISIPYLNEVVDSIMKQIAKAKPNDGIYCDFSTIIEKLQ